MLEQDIIGSLCCGVMVIGIAGLILRLFWKSLSPQLGEQEKRRLIWMVAAAFTLKIGLVLIWYASVGGLYIDSSVADQRGYTFAGEYIATQIRSGVLFPSPPPQLGAHPGYFYVVGILYAAFGDNPMVVSLFNALLSVVFALLMYQIAERLFSSGVGKGTLVLNLFYPAYIPMCYFLMKDITIVFLVVGTAWALVCLRRPMSKLLGVFIFVFLLMFFRLALGLLVGVLAVLQFLVEEVDRRQRMGQSFIPPFIAVVLFAGAFYIMKPGGRSVAQVGFTTSVTAYHAESPGYLQGERLAMNWPSLVGIAKVLGSAPKSFIYHSIESTFHIFWGPPFLYSRSGPMLYEPLFRTLSDSTGALFVSFLIPMVAYGLVYSIRSQCQKTLLLWAFPTVLTPILVFTGNVYRWRLPMMAFLFMFGAIGCHHWNHIKSFYPLYIMAFNILVAVNASLKQGLVVGLSTTVVTFVCLVLVVLFRSPCRVPKPSG